MLVAILIATVSAFSPPNRDAQSVLRALEARYHHAQTLKAAFYERYSDAGSAEGGSAESGVVYFSQPGRMRWEYQSPEQKLFIVDGTNVWFYVPAQWDGVTPLAVQVWGDGQTSPVRDPASGASSKRSTT